MKVVDNFILDKQGYRNARFIRIEPEDLSVTLSQIISTLMDLSWLSKFKESFEIDASTQFANLSLMSSIVLSALDLNASVTSDAGEYVVSVLSREALINELNYLDIPLAELLGKKKSGNPGFDFHSQNLVTDTIIFGEAKYVATRTAYSSALPQIVDFINEKKDLEDLPDLKPFCTTSALDKASKGQKGFAAAFSARRTKTQEIIDNIIKRSDFQSLVKHEEVILLAVNI